MMQDMEKEFSEFLKDRDESASAASEAAIFSRVRKDLELVRGRFFAKLALTQLVAGLLTLLVCPQFGFGPLGGGHGVMSIVMDFGPAFCAVFCGSIFLGSSALASVFVFTWAERRYLYKQRLWIFGLLGVASVAILMLASAVHFQNTQVLRDLEFALLWLVGGAALAQALFQLGYRVRESLEPRLSL